jgi:glycosyltransferase involved in cell wall biosynthesis
MDPLFSVITVVYNGAAKLQETLDSLFMQEFSSWELIVIDGASTDSSVDIIKKNAERISYWVSEKDKGLYDAMNKGIAAARGEYLYFLNVGDLLAEPGVLQHVAALSGNKPALIYGLARTHKNPMGFEYTFGREISLRDFYFNVAPICHQASFIHRDVFRKIGNYDLRYRLFADMDHFIRIFRDKSLKKAYTHYLIAYYEVEGLSFNNRFISLRENLNSAWRHLPWYISSLKTLNFPILWMKVSMIRLLSGSAAYLWYKKFMTKEKA